ncbi:hypothetical protein GCM10022397_44320 [Flavivirga jejuensis]
MEVLVYPENDKRAHAREREPIYLSSRFHKKLPVFHSRFKAIASNIFYTEELQIYVFKYKYIKKNNTTIYVCVNS